MNTIIKLVLTLLLVLIVIYPYFEFGQVPGGLNEFQSLGLPLSILITIIFFTAIAFYCKSLQKVLEKITPENRTRKPKSVWYMYLIPFNFIEDFFIVIDLSNSLTNEMKTKANLAKFGDFGLTLGIGWSVAQLFSFIPNIIGQVSGFVGILMWILHWRLMHEISKELE